MTNKKQEQASEQEQQPDSEFLEGVGDIEGVDLAENDSDNQKEDSQPENELEILRNELAASRDQLLRIAADSENFKKRMEREKEALIKYAGENILRELLPTLDNLDRALEHETETSDDPQQSLDALLEGVKLTQKGLLAAMEKYEVCPLASIGREFDPNQHEAMTVDHSDEIPENHVLQEFSKGYTYKDRLLRAAKVIVSKGPADK